MLHLPKRRPKRFALLGLAVFFFVAGANHFLNPGFYVGIMPLYLPAHLGFVYVSGLLEILGGVAVLSPALRTSAGWGLIILLIAIFPANLHMALHPESFPDLSSFALYSRLPVQALFIAWAYWATRPDSSPSIKPAAPA